MNESGVKSLMGLRDGRPESDARQLEHGGTGMGIIKQAYYEFDPERLYCCEGLNADWVARPSIGMTAPALEVKVTLLVHYEIADEKPHNPKARQAAVFVAVDRELHVVCKKAADFLAAVGIQLRQRERPYSEPCRYVLCKFGTSDPIFQFQPIVWWCRAGADQFVGYRTSMEKSGSGKSWPLGLRPDPATRTVRRGQKKAEFKGHGKAWAVLERLAARHPDRYPVYDLIIDIWDPQGLDNLPESGTLYSHLHTLKKLLRRLDLSVNNQRGLGYKLEERVNARPRPRSRRSR
jgi:hypothetical protein